MFYCPHGPKDGCDCRKPKPGLLTEIGNRFQVSLGNVIFVGDNINDVKAARAAGAKPVIVRTGKGEKTADMLDDDVGDVPVYQDLSEVVNTLLHAQG